MIVAEQKSLGDCAKVISGYAFKSKDFAGSGVPVVKIANIKHEHVSFENAQFLPEDFLAVPDRYHVRQGDVMISLTGSHVSQPNSVVGRVARYRHNSVALLNQRAARIVIHDPESLDQAFLYYFLRQKEVTHALALNAGGAANQANISPTDVENIKLPLIPFTSQTRIAAILSAYDDLIENNRRRIALLERAARLLYREWFVHFRFPGHETAKFVDGLPEGWRMRALSELAQITMGQSPKSEFYNNDGDGLPFHQGVTHYGFRFVEDKMFSTAITKLANAGDILFSVRAPVGRINYTLNNMVLGRGLSAFRSRSGHQSFLFYCLKSHFFKENLIGGGAIFAATNKKELESLEVICPSEALVASFDEKASMIDAQIKTLSLKNRQLTKARDLLLPRLMDGRIPVKM